MRLHDCRDPSLGLGGALTCLLILVTLTKLASGGALQ